MARRAYKKIDFSEPRRGRRRKWKDMEILRIKLNPEQAVIACCDSAWRGVTYMGAKCVCPNCPGGTYAVAPSS